MPEFIVQLTATAFVTGFVKVEAEDEASASTKAEALAHGGDSDIEWKYDGIDDNSGVTVSRVVKAI